MSIENNWIASVPKLDLLLASGEKIALFLRFASMSMTAISLSSIDNFRVIITGNSESLNETLEM